MRTYCAGPLIPGVFALAVAIGSLYWSWKFAELANDGRQNSALIVQRLQSLKLSPRDQALIVTVVEQHDRDSRNYSQLFLGFAAVTGAIAFMCFRAAWIGRRPRSEDGV